MDSPSALSYGLIDEIVGGETEEGDEKTEKSGAE
jgi:hypothetical protein